LCVTIKNKKTDPRLSASKQTMQQQLVSARAEQANALGNQVLTMLKDRNADNKTVKTFIYKWATLAGKLIRAETDKPRRQALETYLIGKQLSESKSKPMPTSKPKSDGLTLDRLQQIAAEITANQRRWESEENQLYQDFVRADVIHKDKDLWEKKDKRIALRESFEKLARDAAARIQAIFDERKNLRPAVASPAMYSTSGATGSSGTETGVGDDKLRDFPPVPADEFERYSISSVVGMPKARKAIAHSLWFPILFPKASEAPPKGMLFYGAPGTGKTQLVRAAIAELHRTLKDNAAGQVVFYNVNSGDLLGKYVGDSEKLITKLFRQASKSACQAADEMADRAKTAKVPSTPNASVSSSVDGKHSGQPASANANDHRNENPIVLSVIFIDEIDSIAPRRDGGSDDNGINAKVVNTFLQMLDGLQQYPNVVVIGATNFPWVLDKAFLRRFPVRIHCEMPTAPEIVEFLNLELSKYFYNRFHHPDQYLTSLQRNCTRIRTGGQNRAAAEADGTKQQPTAERESILDAVRRFMCSPEEEQARVLLLDGLDMMTREQNGKVLIQHEAIWKYRPIWVPATVKNSSEETQDLQQRLFHVFLQGMLTTATPKILGAFAAELFQKFYTLADIAQMIKQAAQSSVDNLFDEQTMNLYQQEQGSKLVLVQRNARISNASSIGFTLATRNAVSADHFRFWTVMFKNTRLYHLTDEGNRLTSLTANAFTATASSFALSSSSSMTTSTTTTRPSTRQVIAQILQDVFNYREGLWVEDIDEKATACKLAIRKTVGFQKKVNKTRFGRFGWSSTEPKLAEVVVCFTFDSAGSRLAVADYFKYAADAVNGTTQRQLQQLQSQSSSPAQRQDETQLQLLQQRLATFAVPQSRVLADFVNCAANDGHILRRDISRTITMPGKFQMATIIPGFHAKTIQTQQTNVPMTEDAFKRQDINFNSVTRLVLQATDFSKSTHIVNPVSGEFKQAKAPVLKLAFLLSDTASTIEITKNSFNTTDADLPNMDDFAKLAGTSSSNTPEFVIQSAETKQGTSPKLDSTDLRRATLNLSMSFQDVQDQVRQKVIQPSSSKEIKDRLLAYADNNNYDPDKDK
jgi:SpoVK/Ycf46/Vps4 family AAA+-type ATPase